MSTVGTSGQDFVKTAKALLVRLNLNHTRPHVIESTMFDCHSCCGKLCPKIPPTEFPNLDAVINVILCPGTLFIHRLIPKVIGVYALNGLHKIYNNRDTRPSVMDILEQM